MEKLTEDWSFEEVLEPETGVSYNNYFYKGRPAHRLIVDTPKSRVLASYIAIEKDLRSGIFWLENILEIYKDSEENNGPSGYFHNKQDRHIHNLTKGLFVASLTFYGKCFGSSEGRSTKLEKANLDEQFHPIHDIAMKYRHNFAAHSGAELLETTNIVTALDPKKRGKPYLAWELNQPDTFGMSTIRDLIDLFEHSRKFALEKRELLLDKVYEQDVLGKGMKYWYKQV
ncbi:hypothetical protein RMQ50_004891 [Vibrio alginolyticus]|nr:hypothetical protein [Vibrio alginolyticus]